MLKISKNWVIINIIIFVSIVLLMIRYNTLGYERSNVILSFLYFVGANLLLFFSYIKFKTAINPISAYTVFIFLFAYSIIPLSSYQHKYSATTYSVVTLSIIFYLLPILSNVKIRKIKFFEIKQKQRASILPFLVICACIVFVLECIRFGFIPFLAITSRDIYIETNEKLIPFLHYFIVLTAYIPAWAYIYYKEGIITKKKLLIITVVTAIILLNYLSRQVYLLLALSLIISYSFYTKVNIKSILKIIFIALGLFFTIGYLKFHSDATDSFSEFMRLIAGIKNEKITIIESTFVEYSSKRYSALDKIIETKNNLGFYGYGMYTFRPLISLLLLEKFGIINRIPDLDSEVLVSTYASDPYLDFGIIGVVMINFIYGLIAYNSFRDYENKSPVAIIVWSIIIFCCIMGMFINYFNTMLIWLGLFFNKLLFYNLKKE